MKLDFDSEPIEIPCAKCGRKLRTTIGKVKLKPDLVCPSCGAINAIDRLQLERELAEAKKRIDRITRGLR